MVTGLFNIDFIHIAGFQFPFFAQSWFLSYSVPNFHNLLCKEAVGDAWPSASAENQAELTFETLEAGSVANVSPSVCLSLHS